MCTNYSIPGQVLEEALPDAGFVDRSDLYKNILDISSRNSVRFSVKARSDAHILLSKQPVSSDRNLTDNFVEVGVCKFIQIVKELCISSFSESSLISNTIQSSFGLKNL